MTTSAVKIGMWCGLAALIGLSSVISKAQENSPQIPITNSNWGGTDDLGRTLPGYSQTGPPKDNRWVGLFYWQWHVGELRGFADAYDLNIFLAAHPYFKQFKAFPPGGPNHPTYYWGEPVFGYYRSDDPWVIRKQLGLITAAGVDFLFLDYTNSGVYDDQLQALLDVIVDMKAKGMSPPRLTFFLNHDPAWKVEHLYNKWYAPGKYDDIWFRWRGKPLILAPLLKDDAKFKKDPALIPTVRDYFTFRPTWALFNEKKDPTKWRFMGGLPCPLARDSVGQPEQVAVNKSTGGPVNNNLAGGGVSGAPGKIFKEKDYSKEWLLPDRDKGIFFQHSWDNAHQLAPPIVLVTGWNEWTASVWETPGVPMLGKATKKGEGHIVDEFNHQFNRDIEPVRGGTSDSYYWQFVANMRRYKGMKPEGTAYQDTVGDAVRRDFAAHLPTPKIYQNNSARNDITRAEVLPAGPDVVFTVESAAALSPSTDKNWMWLLVDTDSNPKTGWRGYDLIVNRRRSGGDSSIEVQSGTGWVWRESTLRATFTVSGKTLRITMPRAAFPAAGEALHFNFKWADNLPDSPAITDFYTEGDVAPDGRFNYRF